ncbi:fungal-specific transcription factor domain-containing protein [Talaromyces proteolyticus]|uniref:Fungal-specific transcription factor domain-containing protein n=1 Tax=Talaromyces proteolyticus TaxID=1131652 RepID=A0AAD4Q2S5_9EURO|nr:fungal-specific transcription factor domain-containing protein [Talaromyces proteolyticus]KAH8700687.1 fungal-specific transcription factor domain-containing protein [Talaromyces proteolyticus]
MPTKRETGKAVTSCTECQRDLQCSREWPCNHCQSRNIPHLCQFITGKPDRNPHKISKPSSSNKRTSSGIRKESCPKTAPISSDVSENSEDEGFRAMGYMPDEGSFTKLFPDADGDFVTSDTEAILSSMPPKPYMESLVRYYLNELNYQYYILYPPQFLQEYTAWWAKRANGQKLGAAFTCLLLRVCACATQSVGGELRQKLELELGEKTQNLSQRYHEAAQQLSSKIPSRKGGLSHVQQLLLTAAWFKTEALFADSWQALGPAIHKAQELGMHKDALNRCFADFECEMRRRVWCILYIWDWQMSSSLSRPLIISDLSFEMPTEKLENDSENNDNLPSPITHIILQCQLIQNLSKIRGLTMDDVPDLQVYTALQAINDWFEFLPSVYHLSDPDTRWDEAHHYVLLQRLQLHTIGNMLLFQLLKPFLSGSHQNGKYSVDDSLTEAGVDCALKLVDISHRFYDLSYPIYSKFHVVIFVMFDTIAALCSAITHDTDCELYRRQEAIKSIYLILSLLDQVKHFSKTAAVCHRTLSRLVIKLPLSSQERLSDVTQSSPSFGGNLGSSEQSLDEISASNSFTLSDTPENPFPEGLKTPALFDLPDISFENGHFPTIGDLSVMDLGGIGWENIGLEMPLGFVP